MPNDLEEFLRQAAAMRQQKSLEQRAETERQREQQARSRPPTYTSARQERLVDAARFDDNDEDVVAGIEVHQDKPARIASSSTRQQREGSASATPVTRVVKADARQTNLASELRKMLAHPDGVRQAFLVREILNRPRF